MYPIPPHSPASRFRIYLIGQNFGGQNFQRTKFFGGQNFWQQARFPALLSADRHSKIYLPIDAHKNLSNRILFENGENGLGEYMLNVLIIEIKSYHPFYARYSTEAKAKLLGDLRRKQRELRCWTEIKLLQECMNQGLLTDGRLCEIERRLLILLRIPSNLG